MAYAIFEGAHGSKFVGERGFGEIVARISLRSGAAITSHAREKAARPWLEKIGKHDQAYLYEHQHEPGFNPANPPGRSTHERRNDGVAYAGPPGMWLAIWQRGIDCVPSDLFIREAVREGFTATVTYPHSRFEGHHVNFRKAPAVSLWRTRPLHQGDTGRRVRWLIHALKVIRSPITGTAYLPADKSSRIFDGQVKSVVMQFQRDHHQKADGIAGLQTRRQLGVSLRYWSKPK